MRYRWAAIDPDARGWRCQRSTSAIAGVRESSAVGQDAPPRMGGAPRYFAKHAAKHDAASREARPPGVSVDADAARSAGNRQRAARSRAMRPGRVASPVVRSGERMETALGFRAGEAECCGTPVQARLPRSGSASSARASSSSTKRRARSDAHAAARKADGQSAMRLPAPCGAVEGTVATRPARPVRRHANRCASAFPCNNS